MALNPLLVLAPGLGYAPLPFPGEVLLLHRDAVDFACNGLARYGLPDSITLRRGRLFLSSVRLVFVSAQGAQPLQAFDVPLLFLRGERFNQPVFGANYLSGAVFSVRDGPEAPPHAWSLSFKEGGVGTLLPLFFNALEAARGSLPSGAEVELQDLRSSALVDPGDPSHLFLPGSPPPAAESAALPERYPRKGGKED